MQTNFFYVQLYVQIQHHYVPASPICAGM